MQVTSYCNYSNCRGI